MKYICIKTAVIYLFTTLPLFASAFTQKVDITKSVMVGDRIAKFIPAGYDAKSIPSFAIDKEPREQGALPPNWELIPDFTSTNGKANASLSIPEGTSIYGGGEVTGPLLRNGKTIKLWNTDSGAYGVDNGKRLYQSHPWMMGVRKDGTAFGILFDTSWKAELSCTNQKIELKSEGVPFRVFIIDRDSPQAVVRGLSELTGTMPMIPRWALGYQQSRFSYTPANRVIEIADTFRQKKIPCDVIWMDIDYMDGYRIFTFNPTTFPNPKAVNRDLHIRGFHSAWMIDPGAKVDPDYFVYKSGTENDIWVKTADGKNFTGDAWPGAAAFPDFTYPKANKWWRSLYKDFLAQGVDGVWNDVNEPQINDTPNKTMPENNFHRGGGKIPAGTHLQYHNVYGFLMVKASREGIMDVRPEKRPFILTRSNFLGGQRYAATWTGDNGSSWEHLKMSVPMSLTLGLSGQPFSGADIGGFLFNANADLFGNWIGFGAFYPFARGHACAGTNNKEPWAFGKEIEDASRIALERRYILLPYFYTLLHEASTNGMPIMRPVFFADPKDLSLRAEEEAFLIGDDLLIIPAFANHPNLPKGIWRELSLVEGDKQNKYQAKIKLRGGSIVPTGKIIQNTNEKSLDPLTLLVCLDSQGQAKGTMYWDAGDGWTFKKGDYSQQTFTAEKDGNTVIVRLADQKGKYKTENNNMAVVKVITEQGIYHASGDLTEGIEIKL
ncbi:TIM-barrel domain-containing protein [Bacteroides finegoldii]|jgi:alpha-glucosidase|uniref:TIM-barrel domain-containing protein n=1 Tax=Bacteroides finegoldii TaxID=338188 RepID=UPI00189CBC66|nr:TIM-barrel domain-containing protein [Bacteroides finegoldii]MDC7139056.1 glycoside hydrolase family 31 protein [Bacteroides finegoldii]